MTGINGFFLFGDVMAHIDTMCNTGDVGQDDGASGIAFGFHERFDCLVGIGTHGDLGDIDISASIDFHYKHGKAATLTATCPPGRFGALDIRNGQVNNFKEKPKGDGAMINGGFFVLSPEVLSYIDTDETVWEQEPLMRLADDGKLMAYEHQGFWQPMDTLRDKHLLEKLWVNNEAPWKKW